jgi:hypothetical protein
VPKGEDIKANPSQPEQLTGPERIGLARLKKDAQSERTWLLSPIHDSTIKTLILGGFFACAFSSIVFGGCRYMKAESQESEREAVGLITNIMSGITGIAAGVFTSGNLR